MMESRPQLIWRHVERFVRATSVSWPTFAATVREQYERLVPEGGRLVEWSGHRDPHKRMQLDAQTVRRFAHDYPGSKCDFDLPCEVEEALVFALGELGYADYQALLTELAERLGMLPVMIPHGATAQDLHLGAGVMKEAADAVQAIAALTADDGDISVKDKAKDLRHAQIQIREAMGMLASADQRVAAVLREKGFSMPAPVRVVK